MKLPTHVLKSMQAWNTLQTITDTNDYQQKAANHASRLQLTHILLLAASYLLHTPALPSKQMILTGCLVLYILTQPTLNDSGPDTDLQEDGLGTTRNPQEPSPQPTATQNLPDTESDTTQSHTTDATPTPPRTSMHDKTTHATAPDNTEPTTTHTPERWQTTNCTNRQGGGPNPGPATQHNPPTHIPSRGRKNSIRGTQTHTTARETKPTRCPNRTVYNIQTQQADTTGYATTTLPPSHTDTPTKGPHIPQICDPILPPNKNMHTREMVARPAPHSSL